MYLWNVSIVWLSLCCNLKWETESGRNLWNDWYKKDTYLKVYAEMIHVVSGVKDYIKTPYEPLNPPQLKKTRGIPKKMRRRGPDEIQNTSTRKGLTHTCSNCMEIGHNKKGYKNPAHFDELPTQGSQGSQPFQEPVARGPATVDELPTQGSQDPQTSQKLVTRQEVAETQESPQQNQEQNQQKAMKTKESSSGGRGKGKQARSEGATDLNTQSTTKPLPVAASSSANVAKKRNKMPTIDQVLQNIRDKAKNRLGSPDLEFCNGFCLFSMKKHEIY
ncbi:UNVERIFIED_CONTAM: hypothetical protein Slati_0225100 [Sesamum latifolium]|uniref:Uncharacterized protein n=1 Tax=Sesamum latifolium TaxID=2727402 RepID=A0AAW2YC03_9LAMI